MANVTLGGLPQNIYPNSNIGVISTNAIYLKYSQYFSVDNNTSKISIREIPNDNATWKEILQVFQNVDNWAQLNPNDVTPTIERVVNILMKLRRVSETDAPYDAYELILFWNIAVRPDYFLPIFFTESIYSTYVTLAKEYTYEMLFTRVQNDRQRAVNPNSPIVTPQENYPNYNPPTNGSPSPSNPNTPVTPSTGTKTSNVWTWVALVFVLVLIILIMR
ncbi:hypothetical protein [Runella sp.]|uniref:hypothetical protein n=1 Tax=Runella sp. TaxID=1960881 RepID=UPI003D0FDB99